MQKKPSYQKNGMTALSQTIATILNTRAMCQ